jgi:hypothetical protein
MASSWFPELPKRTTEPLLRNVCLQAKDLYPDQHRVLVTLIKLGLVQTRWRPYVLCSYRKDPDFRRRRDLSCPGRIEIDRNDPEGAYYCPGCGRPVTAVSRKQHFLQYDIQINQLGVKRYLQRALHEMDVADRPPAFMNSSDHLSLALPGGAEISLFLFDYVGRISQAYEAIMLVVNPYLLSRPVGLPHLNLLDFLSLPMAEVKRLWSEANLASQSGRTPLRTILVRHFSLADMHRLCEDLGEEPENVPGKTLGEFAAGLIRYCEHRLLVVALVRRVGELRPNAIL